jgi:hypothetical protein
MTDPRDRDDLDRNIPQADEDVRGRADKGFDEEDFEEDLEDEEQYGTDRDPVSEVE